MTPLALSISIKREKLRAECRFLRNTLASMREYRTAAVAARHRDDANMADHYHGLVEHCAVYVAKHRGNIREVRDGLALLLEKARDARIQRRLRAA